MIKSLQPLRLLLIGLLTARLAGVTSPAMGAAAARSERGIDFVRDIQPILAASCHKCHGPTESKNGLRLDRRRNALEGSDAGPVIIPGKSNESRLIQYVTGSNDDKIVMPPKGDRLSDEQIRLLSTWIDQGADWPQEPAAGPAEVIEHWAFEPPRPPPVPQIRNPKSEIRNPIDAFILARLDLEKIEPSPEADSSTLIRRLYLDLLGLPPPPEEVDQFVTARDPKAYERLVERLLASPHFGERWGRHWLDLVRYADSDGYEDDKFRPDAWRYRDWVIDAFNRDLPFSQFTLWQIAGDLLPDADYEQRLATGFHRMTLSNNAGAGGVKEEYRVKTAKDRLSTTATAWLGLTVACAECHSHKYDPISQREYYQFYAFFDNVEEVTITAPNPGERYQREFEEATRAFEDRLKKVRRALADYEKQLLPVKQQQWEAQARDDESLPEAIRAALPVLPEQRTTAQRDELRKYFRSIDPEYAALKAVVPVGDEVGNNKPLAPSERALVVEENSKPRKTFLQRKGDFLKPGVEVQPATPAFLHRLQPRDARADRLDLARWIIDPRNPLTSRVAVNHLWQVLFGQGLVATADNFGVKGGKPSHPELLDWLADQFVARGWSRKELIRLIVNSATYRRSSRGRPDLREKDPSNMLLARQNRLRLEAESIRDAALAASGLLNPEAGGPSFQPPLPTALAHAKELKNERFMETSSAWHRYRRGVYINVQRTFLFPMLKTFDVADANVCTVRRERSNTPLQALTLLNDPVFFEAAQALGLRVLREGSDGTAARLARLYQLCLARSPEPEERATLEKLLAQQIALGRENVVAQVSKPAVSPTSKSAERRESAGTEDVEPTEAAAWTGLARAVLNFDEFITRE
ncbi:MAG: PSD1 and planctomycete cytochrome C domain-containing protein [Verrucomicrobiales bacterium]|nr:PSD1 and planctomycete cytochrome C domain-containing protein [Verrucomicrobiales bacterium]